MFDMQTNDRHPVLLVHGLHDRATVFAKMTPRLVELGWPVYDINLKPNNGKLRLERLAEQVAELVDRTFAPNEAIDLVGFSMGGLVSRYYIQRLGGIDRVRRFVTISSPNQGTKVAYLSGNPGCVQMRPGSDFLEDLNRDDTWLKQLNVTTMWTPYDLMIVPASSSQIPNVKEVVLPVSLHPWMLTDSRSIQAVVEALSEPLKVQPKNAELRSLEVR
jgi:triacylglycerol lipase